MRRPGAVRIALAAACLAALVSGPARAGQGDVNGDGAVDLLDAFQVCRFLAGGPPPARPAEGDVTGDGITDDADRAAILRAAVGRDTIPPFVGIDFPPAGFLTNLAGAEVRGTVEDPSAGVVVNGVAAVVTGNLWVASGVPLVEGPNTLVAMATDAAGNTATASVTGTLDSIPPAVGAQVNPAPNAAGWHRTDATVSFTCQDGGSGVAFCPAPVLVTAEGANQTVAGTGTDNAGNSAQAAAVVSLDRTPPSLTISGPAAGAVVAASQVTVEGTAQDVLSGLAELTVNGAAVTPAPSGAFSVPVPLTVPGPNTLMVVATDVAGNAAQVDVEVVFRPVLTVAITRPANLSLFNAGPITVEGTVDDAAATVVVNGVAAVVSQGSPPTFTAQVPLREGNNVVTATGTGPAGNVGTAAITVTLDTTAPVAVIETPRAGAVLTSLQVDVAGLINDVIAGTTINADDCHVTVNGVDAAVVNRSFVVPDLLLQRGLNTITVLARDRAGNERSASIEVTVEDQTGQRIVLVSGNNQSGLLGSTLPEPLVVTLVDASGDPVPGKAVTFRVTRGDGQVSAFPEAGSAVTVDTDDNGLASVLFTLGGRAGAGNHRVTAEAPGFLGQVEFCAAVTQGPPDKITVLMGDNQRGVAGQPLPMPLEILVTDAAGNPVGGVDVTFTVTQGAGSFDGSPSLTRATDSDGLVKAVFTVDAQPGINNNVVVATFPGLAGAPATFTAGSEIPGGIAGTTFSGVVLDNQDIPIEGVTVHIEGTAAQGVTDAEGQFLLTGVPVGAVRLLVDGTTANRPGEWPVLEFDTTTIAGRDNTVGMPIYLLPLDTVNSRVVGGPQDVTLRMAEIPGAEMTVFAGSARCPGGATTCRVIWTQVNGERVPMPPPLGSSFMLAWTVQPAGARFDPPARVCIPNMGSPPGQQVEIFSFDHDLGVFVAVGTATVTADGAQICSDPGFGIIKSGWGGCVPPPPPPTCTCSCDDGNDCTQDNCSGPPSCRCSHQKLTNSMCCNGVKFDPATQGCCNGKIYTKATQCCEMNMIVAKNPIADLNKCPNRVPNPSWTFQYDGCSNPVPFIDKDNPAGGRDTQFANAARTAPCDDHDRCYQTCNPAAGAKDACDLAMLNGMLAVCNASTEPQNIVDSCRTWANRYYNIGLRSRFAQTAFDNRQKQVCNCCP